MWRRYDRDDPAGTGLMRLALTDAQAESLARIQALMTLMEGYSNHVMRETGRTVIPGFEALEARMQSRERARGGVVTRAEPAAGSGPEVGAIPDWGSVC